ncbi:SLAM family member 5-like [Polyodon spathula]|uniref:SLAM family member 5-like n=1 Tax=Polyodon spathula TaxID=7913 RepID=UPI001B7F75B2|nr:SLAM family member 5-like [Polyodon spathula]
MERLGGSRVSLKPGFLFPVLGWPGSERSWCSAGSAAGVWRRHTFLPPIRAGLGCSVRGTCLCKTLSCSILSSLKGLLKTLQPGKLAPSLGAGSLLFWVSRSSGTGTGSGSEPSSSVLVSPDSSRKFFPGSCLSAAQPVTKQVNGFVGDSFTFPVEIPNLQPDTEINWRYGPVDPDSPIARIQNGKIYVFEERFRARLQLDNVTSSLRINNLETADSGFYQVEKFKGNKFMKRFCLSVYTPVPEPGVMLIHAGGAQGNSSCTLLCFVGNASEGITVSWMRDGTQLHTRELELSLEMQGGNVTYTCVASNPASNRTTTVTPSEYCDERKDNKGGPENPRSHILIPGLVIAVTGVLAVILIVLYLRRKKPAFEREGSERSRVSGGIEFAEVTAAPPAGNGQDIPELAGARETTEKLITIYDKLRPPRPQNVPG